MPAQTVHTIIPAIVTMCAPRRPIAQPKRPAKIAPTRGASGTTRYSFCIVVMLDRGGALSLQPVEILDVYRADVAEQDDQDRQTDRRFGRGHGEDEEYEDLARGVVQIVRERDEV